MELLKFIFLIAVNFIWLGTAMHAGNLMAGFVIYVAWVPMNIWLYKQLNFKKEIIVSNWDDSLR